MFFKVFKVSRVLASAFCCSFAFSALAAVQVGDHASYDTKTKLDMNDKTTDEHFMITDTVKSIGDDGIVFDEVRKADDGTSTTEEVTYSEAHWLMLPSDGPQTGDEAIKQCGTYPNSTKVSVPLKSGAVDGCEVTQVDEAFHLKITYAPVPLFIYSLNYQDADANNHFELTQQFQEEK